MVPPAPGDKAAVWNRERVRAQKQATWRMRLYNLSPAEFEAMMVRQDHECLICTKLLTRPVVDHDHLTGTVRGRDLAEPPCLGLRPEHWAQSRS